VIRRRPAYPRPGTLQAAPCRPVHHPRPVTPYRPDMIMDSIAGLSAADLAGLTAPRDRLRPGVT